MGCRDGLPLPSSNRSASGISVILMASSDSVGIQIFGKSIKHPNLALFADQTPKSEGQI